MLTRLLLLLALPLVAADPGKVLFIGNSYTGVNNLPKVYAEIAKSAGLPVDTVRSSTPGGRTLKQHLGIKSTSDLIDQGGWDLVVLQGQSQEAALSETSQTVRNDFLEGGLALIAKVREKSPKAASSFIRPGPATQTCGSRKRPGRPRPPWGRTIGRCKRGRGSGMVSSPNAPAPEWRRSVMPGN